MHGCSPRPASQRRREQPVAGEETSRRKQQGQDAPRGIGSELEIDELGTLETAEQQDRPARQATPRMRAADGRGSARRRGATGQRIHGDGDGNGQSTARNICSAPASPHSGAPDRAETITAASASDSARNRIQPKQTKAKQRHAQRPQAGGGQPRAGAGSRARSITSARPCSTPQQKGPGGAVPQAAQEHRQHEVGGRPPAPCRLPPSGM